LNRSVDQRPLDKFDTHSLPQILHSEAEHPFSFLSPQGDDDVMLRKWKCDTVDQEVVQPSFSHLDVSNQQGNQEGGVDQNMANKQD